MKNVRKALEDVLAGGRFTAVEARKLLGIHWPYEWELQSLPTHVANSAQQLHLLIEHADDVVREGFFAEADDDPKMLEEISKFLRLLPEEPIQPPQTTTGSSAPSRV